MTVFTVSRALGAALLVGMACSAMAATPTYRVEDLGGINPGLGSDAMAINRYGQAVGNSTDMDGVMWAVGFTGDVKPLTGVTSPSEANGINRKGQIVGGMTVGGNYHAFTWDQDVATDIGTLGGATSNAYGIADRGHVVGTSAIATGQTHAFLWAKGSVMHDLGTLGGPTSTARAINAHSTIVGFSELADHSVHAFISTKAHRALMDLGVVNGPYAGGKSFAMDVNADEIVTGSSTVAPGSHDLHAFRWTAAGGFVDLGTLGGGTESGGRAVTPAGYVVGYAIVANGDSHGWIVKPGGTTLVDLNDHLDPATGAGWVINDVCGIDTDGQIIGTGTIGGVTHAYKLTPMN